MTFETLIRDGLSTLERADYEGAASLFRRANEIAASDADRDLAAMRLAAIDVLRHRDEPDLAVFRENVLRHHSPLHVSVAAYYLTISAIDRNDRAAATRYLPVLLQNVTSLHDPEWLAKSYDVAAAAESIAGNHPAAIEYGRVALEAVPEGDALLRLTVTHNLAYNCLAAGQYEYALLYAKSAVAASASHPEWHAQSLMTAAFANLCCDRLDEALQTADRAAPLIAGTRLEKYGHYLRGEIARRTGDLEEAEEHFSRLEPFYPGIPDLTEMLLSLDLAPFLLPD